MYAVIDRYEDGVVGLPADGRFVPITNSSASGMTCLHRWWLSEIEGLRRRFSGEAIGRGSSWDTITEDMYLWWEREDAPYPEHALDRCVWCGGHGYLPEDVRCEHCNGTGDGSLVRAMSPWRAALEESPPPFGPDDVEQEEERLRRAFHGYVEMYQAKPLQHFKIVGVQAKVARVVLNPATGKPYRPDTFLVETEAGWVRAGTAALVAAEEAGFTIRRVQWPVYQVGAMDAVARDRASCAGWVIDAKYTGVMQSFHQKLQVAPQMPGYCWILNEPSNLAHYGLTNASAMRYDLVHSRLHSDPYELKWKPPLVGEMKRQAVAAGLDVKGVKGSDGFMRLLGITPGHGGFSTSESKLAGVPSWRMRAAVERAGLDLADYESAIGWCDENVDSRLYDRPWRTFSDDDLNRYAAEVYGKARMMAAHHRAAVRVRRPNDIDAAFPRTPVCAAPGGSCSYHSICMNDSPEARENLAQRQLIVWREGEQRANSKQMDFQKELGF